MQRIKVEMKLKKIDKIKNFKTFTHFSWQNFLKNEELHPSMNLFFGENGSGKSSISTILKSLVQQNVFEEQKPEEVILSMDADSYKYENECWNNTLDNHSILFFDRDFIKKNIHLGFERTRDKEGQEQESGKLIIEFDQEAIKKRKLKNDKEEEYNRINEQMEEFRKINGKALGYIFTTDNADKIYNELKEKSENEIQFIVKELESSKKETENQLSFDKESQKKVLEIQKIEMIQIEKKIPSFSNYDFYQSIFSFDIKQKADTSSDASLQIKIKDHKDFFEKGFSIREVKHDECPFCGAANRETEIKNIISVYKSIYNNQYENAWKEFQSQKEKALNEIERLKDLTKIDFTIFFLKLKEYQEKFKISSIYSVEEEKQFRIPSIIELLNLSKELNELSLPNQKNIKELYFRVDSEMKNILEYLDKLYIYFEEKNELLKTFIKENTDENIRKRISDNQVLLNMIEAKLSFLRDGKIEKQKQQELFEKELEKHYLRLENAKTELNETKREYEAYVSAEAFQKTLNKIQEYFRKFNFNYKLEIDDEKKKGAAPKEAAFAFKIIDINRQPRTFKNGLSEGQLHVLSICFFLAFLDIQSDKNQKIIVFDDPINSLDNSNIGYFVDLLFELKDEFSQFLIFTHHKTFFKFSQKKFKTSESQNQYGHEYIILRNEEQYGGSFLLKSKMDSLKDKLKKFANHIIPKEQLPYILDIELRIIEHGQFLRYELERFVKNELLQWNQDKFPDLVTGVKHSRYLDDVDLDNLKKVYQFCNWTTSHVDRGNENGLDQLRDNIKIFLDVMNNYYTQKISSVAGTTIP